MSDLLAEDLLLLALDDVKGTWQTGYLGFAVGGALLIDMALAGLVEVIAQPKRPTKLAPIAGASSADPILQQALATMKGKTMAAQVWLNYGNLLYKPVLERLAERGLVRPEKSKVLGIFPRTTWPAVANEYEPQLRNDIVRALTTTEAVPSRIGALIGLMQATSLLAPMVKSEGIAIASVKARVQELEKGGWASDAVSAAISSAIAAAASGAAAAASAAAVSAATS